MGSLQPVSASQSKKIQCTDQQRFSYCQGMYQSVPEWDNN
jgi:hypothetical protein